MKSLISLLLVILSITTLSVSAEQVIVHFEAETTNSIFPLNYPVISA
ncbi:MAG: hypothetical protein GY787_13765 [Alteromonadales bacterium]|nr:hypothetical protein [Alteromonadales bacterium]